MALTRKQWIICGTLGTLIAIGLIVGITVGVVVGRRSPAPLTSTQRAYEILANNPLIDG